MRISDWSSDVCSSDLRRPAALETAVGDMAVAACRANARDDAFEFGCRGRAAVGADVELRQLAVLQARYIAATRMVVFSVFLPVRRFPSFYLLVLRFFLGSFIYPLPLLVLLLVFLF